MHRGLSSAVNKMNKPATFTNNVDVSLSKEGKHLNYWISSTLFTLSAKWQQVCIV